MRENQEQGVIFREEGGGDFFFIFNVSQKMAPCL